MAASNPELIPLIYRHLKEHGFHTAAEALQKQSLQSETPPPTSLLDIYSSWLKTSKRKKKSSSSTPGKKPAKPVKAASQRKKKDQSAKQLGSPIKKYTTKGKKVDGKASEKKIKSNKLKVTKKKSGGGEDSDSDSDSSLDVEKWKKLVEQMTDADLAKVEEFNALVSPKPKRVRKSRAKPKPKLDTATDPQSQQSKTPEKSTEDIVAPSNPTVAPVAAVDSSTQEINAEIPVANVTPAQKPSAENKKRKSKDENPSKLKGKTVANGDGEGAPDLVDKPVENIAEISNFPMQESGEKTSSSNLQTEPKKKKKRTLGDGGSILLDDQNVDKDAENTVDKCNDDLITENLSSLSNSAVVESTVVKKKKKKKDKSKEDCVQTMAAETTEKTLEKLTEETDPLTGEVPISAQHLEKEKSPEQNPTKKKKKAATTPIMTTANGEGLDKNVESSTETEKPIQESFENICDLQSEPKKKKKKHKSKEDCVEQINSVTTEETLEKVAEDSNPLTEEMPPKKKKKKKDKSQVELDTLPPEDVIAETPQRTEKKSKKKQCPVSDEVPEEPSDLPSTPQTPAPKKKKHKLGLTEADPSSPIAENETQKKKKKKSSKGQGTEC